MILMQGSSRLLCLMCFCTQDFPQWTASDIGETGNGQQIIHRDLLVFQIKSVRSSHLAMSVKRSHN